MGELRQEFLKQTVSNLQNLQRESFENTIFSEDFLRRFFRQLHTIKGTSRTFDLDDLSHLAHEVENLLQAVQNNQVLQNQPTTSIFQNSFTHLLKLANDYQKGNETQFPHSFADEIRKLLPAQNENAKDLLYHQIPNNFISQLSVQEKTNLGIALQNGHHFYLLEVFFQLTIFDLEFKRFKQTLNENGEVIAVAHATSQNPGETVGFKIFYVSNLVKNEIETVISGFCTKIEFENSPIPKNHADNLAGLLANLVMDGNKVAQLLSKKVAFETSFSKVNTSAKDLILLNDIASHLIHNAIDHAIETVEERTAKGKNPIAKIEISLSNVENTTLLQIRDDGKGIDVEKIISKAKEKGLTVSTEKEAIELIFMQGFTTSNTVSEISGRGVGLDAVKDLVENSGGKIEVETKLGEGTIFKIYLAKD